MKKTRIPMMNNLDPSMVLMVIDCIGGNRIGSSVVKIRSIENPATFPTANGSDGMSRCGFELKIPLSSTKKKNN